eukprot:TRINITY_DN160_c0_g1_i6.p2 TRINITY_DN160_c0_g1~~TRINITY_DN160_c0_g1_i6.p2  ORF type:complete len:107 (-),score=9.42 TRINITY_DN160_c0_g1_i6:143-463(-)
MNSVFDKFALGYLLFYGPQKLVVVAFEEFVLIDEEFFSYLFQIIDWIQNFERNLAVNSTALIFLRLKQRGIIFSSCNSTINKSQFSLNQIKIISGKQFESLCTLFK